LGRKLVDFVFEKKMMTNEYWSPLIFYEEGCMHLEEMRCVLACSNIHCCHASKSQSAFKTVSKRLKRGQEAISNIKPVLLSKTNQRQGQ